MVDINKSIEEIIEDDAKRQLEKLKVKMFSKTASINTEIDEALKKAPSKSGGKGTNFPDIKVPKIRNYHPIHD